MIWWILAHKNIFRCVRPRKKILCIRSMCPSFLTMHAVSYPQVSYLKHKFMSCCCSVRMLNVWGILKIVGQYLYCWTISLLTLLLLRYQHWCFLQKTPHQFGTAPLKWTESDYFCLASQYVIWSWTLSSYLNRVELKGGGGGKLSRMLTWEWKVHER